MAKKYVRNSNLSALKEAWENKSKRGNYKFWKPIKFGRYTVRFLPPNNSDGLFFYETAQHRIGDNYYFCPRSEDDDCPICEYYKSLYDDGSDEAVALAKEIKPRKQYLYNIIVREELGQEVDNPKITHTYMSGKTLYETLMDYFFDEDYGDLTDVENGYDFTIVKEQGDLGFPNYKKSKPRKNPSPLFEDDDDIEEVLENIPDLRAEVEYKSYDELKESLKKFIEHEKSTESFFKESSKSETETEKKAGDEEKANAEVADKNEDADDIDEFEKKLLEELNED